MSKRRNQPLPTSFATGLVFAGVAVVGLGVWALTLQRQNEELRAELASLRGDDDTDTRSSARDDDPEPTVDAPPAPAPTPTPAVADGPRQLDAGQRQLMLERLRTVPDTADRRVWFATAFGDEESEHFQSQIAQVFVDAGFEVVRADRVRFPIRPGIYFMMADEEPPEPVGDVQAAVELAFPDLTSGRGYRAFYEERSREDPEWRGFPMTSDQTFVIAVGRAGT